MSDMTQRDESEVVDLTETQPLGELVAQATADLTTLMRKEVELAKAELTTDLNQAKRGGVCCSAQPARSPTSPCSCCRSRRRGAGLDHACGLGLRDRGRGVRRGRVHRLPTGQAGDGELLSRTGTDHRNTEGGRAMGQTPDELRDEIESAREDLGQTLGAIGDKVSPKQMARRRMERAKTGMSDLRDRVMGSAEEFSDSASSAVGSVGESGREAVAAAGHSIAQTGEAAGTAIAQSTTTGRRTDPGQPVGRRIGGVRAGALAISDPAQPDGVRSRSSCLQQQVVDPLSDQLGSVKQDVVADLRDSAREGSGAIADTARTAAQTVGEEAQAGAAHVADEAQSAAATVKDDVAESAQTVKTEASR